MNIYSNYSLRHFNTFRIDVLAKYFANIESETDILSLKSNEILKSEPLLILGDGANILFTKNFEGLVLKVDLKGFKKIQESEQDVLLEVAAGENWNQLVLFAVENNWGGIENLVAIPGTVGAAPVQNIAAYGQNFSEVFESLDGIDLETLEKYTFDKTHCEFGYRDSVFKTKLKDRILITTIRIRLKKNPAVNTSYFETGKTYTAKVSLEQELQTFAKPPYTIGNVCEAVRRIREKKLPDINKIGTAGSFFKNPIVSIQKYQELKIEDPDLQCYPVDDLSYPKVDEQYLSSHDKVKIPAARLLDKLGWKGKRVGNVGVYENQALAIVNYGGKPDEIVSLYQAMQNDCLNAYNVLLEPEVRII